MSSLDFDKKIAIVPGVSLLFYAEKPRSKNRNSFTSLSNERYTCIQFPGGKSFDLVSITFEKGTFDRYLHVFFSEDKSLDKSKYQNSFYSGEYGAVVFGIIHEVKMIVNQILHCNLRDNFRRVFMECKLNEFLALYFQAVADFNDNKKKQVNLSRQDIEKLQKVKEYLVKEIPLKISIAELCKMAGTNRFKLVSGFQLLFGTSVIKFYRQQCLNRAFTLLKQDKNSVNNIAVSCGYGSIQAFSNAFYKEFSMRPSQLRSGLQ